MINDLKDLKKLLMLCRKQGVMEIKLSNVEFKLGSLPMKHSDTTDTTMENGYSPLLGRELSAEERAFYEGGEETTEDPLGLY